MALRNSLLALRSGGGVGADVVAFKATVDELSRLSAGRAEDEVLLRQLEGRLQELDSAVSRRLLMECHFRDEWRQECGQRALDVLTNAAPPDAGALDRMRNYVALLAPDPDDSSCVQPWQRELLRQQQALADLLKVCPVDSPAGIQSVLSEFMEHSQARLQNQLGLVHDQLQAQELQAGPGCAPHGEGSSGTAENAPAIGAGGSAHHGVLGLTTEEFVHRLRGQHRAICAIQARFRGRQSLLAYRRLQADRVAAAVRVQCIVRRSYAFRTLQAKRHARWLGRCAAITERHSARRLQRAWRWTFRKRQWRTIWLRSVQARAAKDDRKWRRALRATLDGPRPLTPTGFSQFSVYVESKSAQERKLAEQTAARVLQSLSRGLADRRAMHEQARAAIAMQTAVRGWRARTLDRWWRWALCKLHARRSSRMRWRSIHATGQALLPGQTHAVLVHLHVSKEVSRLKAEVTREKCEFEEAFKKWASRMEKHVLGKKLHSDWIPQMNLGSGESYYFNVRTGESSEEHPNMRQVRATERKQRQLAEATISERLNLLRGYEDQLVDGRTEQLANYEQASAAVWRAALPWRHRVASYASR